MNNKHSNLLIGIWRKYVIMRAHMYTYARTQSVISPNCCLFADYLSDDMSTTGPELMVRRPVYQQDELNHLCKYVKPKRIRKCRDLFAWVCLSYSLRIDRLFSFHHICLLLRLAYFHGRPLLHAIICSKYWLQIFYVNTRTG